MWLWHKNINRDQESIWQERLQSVGGAVFSEKFNSDRINVDVYSEHSEEVFVLHACYGGKVEKLPDTDWVANTAPRNTPPLMIRDKIIISAEDSPEVLNDLRERYPRRHVLTFPAEMAFGTGSHATTSACLRMLCDETAGRTPGSWTLSDIGCGTGVLALAGLRLGAASALSFDFDPTAVEIARRNVDRNGGAEQLKLFQADVFEWEPEPGEEADIVLANLFSAVLQKAFPRLIRAMKPQAVLIISGILNTQAEETLRKAEEAGLQVHKVVKRGKWSTAKLTLK